MIIFNRRKVARGYCLPLGNSQCERVWHDNSFLQLVMDDMSEEVAEVHVVEGARALEVKIKVWLLSK